MTGNIALDGSMSGTATTSAGQSATWTTTAGIARRPMYPGLFTSLIPKFYFTTDEYGSGSWHVNLRDEHFPPGAGEQTLSVWINYPGATILVSKNFSVIVD